MELRDIKRVIPSSCFQISEMRSWATLARILLCLAVVLTLEVKLEAWALPVLWFLHGQILVGLFVLAHDCGHGTFSRHPQVNSVIGHLAFAPLGNGFEVWKRTHNHHHAHTQKIGQDVDWSSWLKTRAQLSQLTWRKDFWTKLGYSLPFGIFLWVFLNAVRRGFDKRTLSEKRSNLFMWATLISLYVGLIYCTGLWGLLKYHLIPATIAMYTGYFLLTIQHANSESSWFEAETWTPYKGQIQATFDVRFHPFLEWLWLDINIHIPHHVAPQIPWYHLKTASRELKAHFNPLYQERKMSWSEVKWMLKTPTIDYSPELKTFKLTPLS